MNENQIEALIRMSEAGASKELLTETITLFMSVNPSASPSKVRNTRHYRQPGGATKVAKKEQPSNSMGNRVAVPASKMPQLATKGGMRIFRVVSNKQLSKAAVSSDIMSADDFSFKSKAHLTSWFSVAESLGATVFWHQNNSGEKMPHKLTWGQTEIKVVGKGAIAKRHHLIEDDEYKLHHYGAEKTG